MIEKTLQRNWQSGLLFHHNIQFIAIIILSTVTPQLHSYTGRTSIAHPNFPLKSLRRAWNLKYALTWLAQTNDLVPKQFLRSSNWVMRSELGYFARSLLSGSNDCAATFKTVHEWRADQCCNIASVLGSTQLHSKYIPNTLLKSNVTMWSVGGRCRGSQECGSRNVNFACKFHWRWHAVFGSSHNSEICNIGARAQ